jgi:phosphoribosylglycinamide formyltransferase-1
MSTRLVVLISGTGTLLQALLDAQAAGDLDAEVVAVGADRQASGLARAERAGVPTFVLPLGPDRAAWDQALTDRIASYEPDLIVSAGFMKILGPAFLARYEGRALNTHPALLPAFPGDHAVRDALAAGVTETGATVFLIDAGVDTGPILAQRRVPVSPGDTEASLHERIKQVERPLLVEVVNGWAAGAGAGRAAHWPRSGQFL